MNVTATPVAKSSVKLEVELPPERLSRAVDDAVRRLSRRTRVPGFRPGKAPRTVLERVLGPGVVLDEAVEHLVQDAYRQALIDKEILPLANADVNVEQAEEGKPVRFTATVPVRPDVQLGDYRNFNFRPEIETIDDPKVDQVIEELRDQNATLSPVEDRVAKTGDYAVVGFEGTKDGQPFEGGSSERMPLILGDGRFVPGFEEHIEGLHVGDSTEFDVTVPEDYPQADMAGQPVHFALRLRELREKILPTADDAFAQSMGDYDGLPALRAEIRQRLERNALDKARHEFADKIIEYAVSNSTLELPDVLVDQEVEVMHDEFRASLARQGITEEAYLKVVEKTSEDLHADFRPRSEHRVKVLLVLSKVATEEGIEVPAEDIDEEVQRGRQRYAKDPKLVRYYESERGRNFIQTTLRRTRVVEKLVDDWLAAHTDHPALPHADDSSAPAIETLAAEVAAATAADDEPSEVSPTPAG
jgi:trigger factor